MVDELLQQSAANLLIGSQEDETAQADEGHPWYAACKQTAEKDRFKFLFLQKNTEGNQLFLIRMISVFECLLNKNIINLEMYKFFEKI